MKKKLFILLALLVAMTLVFVACKDDPTPPDDTTVADQPTEEPTQGVEDPTQAPDTDPETPEPGTDEPDEPTTPAPDTDEPETSAPDTDEPETPEPETADPMEPVNVFDADDIQTVTGNDPGHLTQDCVTLEDGFVHIVPIGPDPYYYPFAGVDGARYVAIRYRTDATGADIQMYIGSTGGGPSDDSTMLRQPVVADSEWHVAIFDTQSLIDAGKYDGKYVSYFRFDALEAGYKLNENGETYKNEDGTWARYSLPEGCSIDVAYIGFFHSEEAAKKYDFDLNKAPMWDADKAVIVHQNFDQFFLGNGSPDDATINNLNLYHAVNIPNWDKVATLPDFSVETLTYWGWMALAAETVGTFGYQIDMDDPIYDESFYFTPEQPVVDAAVNMGGKTGTRYLIRINIAGLDGTHTVRVLYKDAEGNEVCMNEITVNLPKLPDDITDSFVSDVNSNEVGTTMDASDLANFFVTELPLPGSGVEANGEGKLYHLTSINDMYADVNGRYFIKANVIDSNASGWMFARGYRVVNSDEIIEKFDPAGGFYKINNYYETDSAGAMGGAGIYARLQGGKLFLMVKYYNPETVTRVGNKMFFIDAAGSELTLADNGSTVSVLVDGVTYATIEMSGSIAYGDINEVDPAGEFAEKAVVTLKDGTTETIENTLIAATCQCQVGFVSRGGSIKFDSVAVGGYSAIEVPALEIVTPEEPEPVDPDAPVLVLTPEFINGQALSTGGQTFTQHIATSEVKTEDEITFVRLTTSDGDPYVALVNIGSMLELPPYMAFSYRTNGSLDAHVFIGSGAGWNGQGDVTSVAWNEDQQWNHTILDLNNAGLTSIQNNLINYCRFDFFTGKGAEGDYMDVEYVAFFNSAEAAEKYYNNLHKADEPEHQHEYTAVVTAPTCTDKGYTTYTCACGDSYVADEVEATGHSYVDGICSCGDVVSVIPEVGKGYIFGMLQGNLNKVYYLKGGMDGYYMATTTDPAQAIYVFIEETEGGYYMYCYVNGAKTYINMVVSGTHVNGQYDATATTVYTIDETSKTLIAMVNGDPYWFGTRNDKTYTTMGPCKTSYKGFYGEFYFAHSHEFVDGKCACGEAEAGEAPHEHNYEYETIVIDPTCTEDGYTVHRCECGDGYIDNEIPATGHNFVDGSCGICGEADPDYVDPDAPATNGVDFSTFEPDDGTAKGTSYTDRTNPDGWTATGSRIEVSDSDCGGILNGAPVIVLNGKTSAIGTLTSPILAGGIQSLSFNLGYFWSETSNISLTLTITGEDGTVITETVLVESPSADTAYTYSYTLETPITGSFGITIENNALTGQDKNKDRVGIWNFTWVSAPASEEPDEPTANEIQVSTTDTYSWIDAVEFTATVSGTYTFDLPAGLGAWDVVKYDNFSGDPYVDFYANENGASFSIDIAAGDTYAFYVGATTKGDWTITWSVEEKEIGGGDEPGTDDPEIPVDPADDISGTYSTGGDDTIVIDMAAGTLVYTFAGRGGAMNTVEYGISIADGVVTLSNANGPITGPMAPYMGVLELDENGKPSKFYYNGYTYDVTAAGAVEPDPEQPEVGDLILVVGNNNITITDEIIAEGGIVYQLVVTEEGTYTVKGDFFVQFQDAMGMTYGNGSYLPAGTYDVRLGTMLISAAGNYNAEVEFTAPEGGDVVDPEPDPEPSGNPVIESLPFTYEITTGGQDTFDVYYDFTAAADVTLIISRPEGALVSLSGNSNDWDTDEDGNYVLFVPAGETVCLNFWTMSPTTVGSFTVSAKADEPEIIEHTVTFVANGETIKTETVVDGAAATAPEAPAVDGKWFAGWDVDFSAVTGDITVTAIYKDNGVFKHASNDELIVLGGKVPYSPFAPGAYDSWNKKLVLEVGSFTDIKDWGWAAFNSETFQYGYIINGGEPIWADAYTVTAGQDIWNAISGMASNCSRFSGMLNAAALQMGDNNVKFCVKLDGGVVSVIREYTVTIIEAAPETEGNYDVPMDTWTVSGHKSGLTTSAADPAVGAAGYTQAAMLHQGSVGVGQVDLSKYSKVIVYYGIDNGAGTQATYNANGTNRIMVTTADNHMTTQPGGTVLASQTYTLCGWAVKSVEIDLTGVDYEGPVYITWDTLAGTFMLIGSIEFVV